jgi:hypothetical protein
MSTQDNMEPIEPMPSGDPQPRLNDAPQIGIHAGEKPERTRESMRALVTKIFDEHDELFRNLAKHEEGTSSKTP